MNFLDKRVINLTVFLMKDYVTDLKDCLKSENGLSSSKLKQSVGLDGDIYYCDSSKRMPYWKSYLDEISSESIDISENASNKAVILAHIKDRIMAVVFGYGRSLLKEDNIERNFGLKVALNTINPNKMRSVNAATIEDMVVMTQRQASYSTGQDEFGINVTNDIMKGLTGEPYDSIFGNHISGKDSLVVSAFMEMSELKDKLEPYYDAFNGERYKSIGFEWVDNVSEIRDSAKAEELDFVLIDAIKNHKVEQLHVAPPETTDWNRIIGFYYSGIRKKKNESENYTLDLDITEYIESINPEINVYRKIQNDKLYAMTIDGSTYAICSIYAALVFQTEYDGKNYILCSGTWYYVEESFYNQVNDYIKSNVPMANIKLPDCPKDKEEADYNKMVADGDENYCLMDKHMVSVENGPKKIEACDLFTRDKKMIHVKNKGQSAQLSHLFSQGKVSAECFTSDANFRKQVSDEIRKKFGDSVFDYRQKPQSNEFEVIYAIIDKKESSLEEKLPFFSKVNLMMTAQELDRMHFKFSICLVKKV